MRVPRERPPRREVDDAPLMLVETRQDLAQTTLPFDGENAAASETPQTA